MKFFQLILATWIVAIIVFLPKQVWGDLVYSGLIGGIDRGDSASLPALGFKIGSGTQDGPVFTYARGGIKSENLFSETERIIALGYHFVSEGALGDMIVGGGIGAVNSTSEVEGKSESVTNGAIVINTVINWEVAFNFGFKIGLDAFIIPVPTINPVIAHGVRNFWYVGIDIGL